MVICKGYVYARVRRGRHLSLGLSRLFRLICSLRLCIMKLLFCWIDITRCDDLYCMILCLMMDNMYKDRCWYGGCGWRWRYDGLMFYYKLVGDIVYSIV